jgi:L-ascorbate metabolism protein UlaG (beta-lactamase superfamily)
VHLGGTRVLGLLVTMDAEQGVEAVRTVDPRAVVPVHYDDYDVFTSGLDDFLAAAEVAGLRGRVHPVPRGGSYRL